MKRKAAISVIIIALIAGGAVLALKSGCSKLPDIEGLARIRITKNLPVGPEVLINIAENYVEDTDECAALKKKLSKESLGDTKFSYEDGVVQAFSYGTANQALCENTASCYSIALPVARVSALENLMGAAGAEVLVHAAGRISVKESNLITSRHCQALATQIKGATETCLTHEVNPNNPKDVKVKAFIAMDITGSDALIEPLYESLRMIEELAPVEPFKIAESEKADGNWTGLILDARNLSPRGLESLAPKILTDDGREVYGLLTVDKNVALDIGIAQFTNDIETANRMVRVIGENPLVVRATGAVGPGGRYFVVSIADAELILKANDVSSFKVFGADIIETNFLKKGRVVIVI